MMEYLLMLALIVAAIFAIRVSMAGHMNSFYKEAANRVQNAANALKAIP